MESEIVIFLLYVLEFRLDSLDIFFADGMDRVTLL